MALNPAGIMQKYGWGYPTYWMRTAGAHGRTTCDS